MLVGSINCNCFELGYNLPSTHPNPQKRVCSMLFAMNFDNGFVFHGSDMLLDMLHKVNEFSL